MPMFAFEGKRPNVHPDAWIAPTATLIGDVTVEANASVWYGAIVRGDFAPVVIREGANIQDNSVLHTALHGVEIGRGATVAHMCVVHDCSVGEKALIGNGATVQDGAKIGSRVLVAAGSLVPPGMEIPPDTMAMGSPATTHKPLSPTATFWVDTNTEAYQQLAERHRAGIELITD